MNFPYGKISAPYVSSLLKGNVLLLVLSSSFSSCLPIWKNLDKRRFSDNGSLVKAFTLTIKYDGSNAMLMTGLSTNTFLMDKTPEQLWDDAFRKFLINRQISWEET